jgi:hypothetical protein
VTALLIVLIVTNLVTLGAFAWYLLRPVEPAPPDAPLAASLPVPGQRRVITIEIRNAIEVAGTHSRLGSLVGSLAPRTTHRVVHDRILKLLRHHLAEQRVDADVRVYIVGDGEESQL